MNYASLKPGKQACEVLVKFILDPVFWIMWFKHVNQKLVHALNYSDMQ